MNDFNKERGISFILALVLIFSVLAIATLGIGIGFVMMNKSRLQNVANLAALSALDVAVTKRVINPVLTPLEVLNQVYLAADLILEKNRIPGVNWGRFLNGNAGKIQLGIWHETDPDGPAPLDPCATNYPCFEQLPQFSPAVTAVRVELEGNNTTNQVIAPFLRLFGSDAKPISVSATAVIAGQCSILLMDVSRSTTYDTHKPMDSVPLLKPGRSQFIYDQNAKSAPPSPANSFSGLTPTRLPTGPITATEHIQSDYHLSPARTTASGATYLLVDKFNEAPDNPFAYHGPQPQTDLFLAVNVALRAIRENAKGSLWRALGFAGLSTEASVSSLPNPPRGFSPGPEPLIQITNIYNRGMFTASSASLTPEIGANIFSFGWYAPPFPVDTSDGSVNEDPNQERTNLIEAFEWAINAFSQTAPNGMSCPSSYAKTIYLVTDGIMNCDKGTGSPAYTCQNSFAKFRNATLQLLDTIVPELQSKKIKVVTLVGGQTVQAHFVNITAPPGYTTSTGSIYLEPNEAIALGYGAYKEPSQNFKLIKEDPSVPAAACATWCGSNSCGACANTTQQNIYAMVHAGQEKIGTEDTIFRLPVSVMAQLSIDTGGEFCPILPVDPDPAAYVVNAAGQLRYYDGKRIPGQPQIYATEPKHAGEQGRECIRRSWQNKLILVEK